MLAFVTGATGFLGSHVARVLAEQGAELRLLVRPTSDLRNIDDLKGDRVVGDLRDAGSISKVLSGCDVVFHVRRSTGCGCAILARCTARMLRARVPCSKRRGNKVCGAWCTRRVLRPWASLRTTQLPSCARLGRARAPVPTRALSRMKRVRCRWQT